MNKISSTKRINLFDKATAVIVFVLLLLAFALRLYKILSIPFNVDEITTISRYVSLPLLDIFTTHHSNNHPMASALAHIFSPQADHLFMLRWSTILVGMLTLPFVYWLGSHWFNRRVGIVALFLVGVSPVHIGYSVTVRGYVGVITLTMISVYLLCFAVRHNRWYQWLGFIGVNLLIVYFHLFGVLPVGMQLGLVGISLLWQLYRQNQEAALPKVSKQLFINFGLTIALLGILYPLLVYAQTSSITLNEQWLNHEFMVWQDGVFALGQELSPLMIFLSQMSPMAPGGVGKYLYLIFWIIGLITIWTQHKTSGFGLVIWFSAPFFIIFVAFQVFGLLFYAYIRFLLYLMPFFLIVVALGMVKTVEALTVLSQRQGWPWQTISQGIPWAGIAGLLLLTVISIYWYTLITTHADWWKLANTLASNLQTEDITICEEHKRGFALPDRAKPHCIWMLEFFVPQLHGNDYTPHFQSSTDFIADYDHLLEHRVTMLEPGGVWLILWQKVSFRPDTLTAESQPAITSPPPLSKFKPYQAWYFGSATLVYINFEETLFGNIYQTLQLLLQVEEEPADRARYYRSLAEMEAIQGHKPEAIDFFEKSWGLVEQAGGQYPEAFLMETKPDIERIPAALDPSETAVEVGYQVGSSICLHSYHISPTVIKAGEPLQLNLNWQTVDLVSENYSFFIRLDAGSEQSSAQLEFQPFDGTYPTPWWWANQRLTDQQEFYIPIDLLEQDYTVYLDAYDKRGQSEIISIPLFSMLYQSDETELVNWQIEPLPSSVQNCLLSQSNLSQN